MLMHEEWRMAADGYEVSDLGRVRSVDRYVPVRGGSRLAKGRILRQFLSKSTGYLQVDLAGVRHSVHRLVALAFCAGYSSDLHVNHVDGNRTNNGAANLEWVTPSENVRHGFRSGRKPTAKGKFGSSHPTSKGVRRIDPETGRAHTYGSAMDAVRDGFEGSCISRACRGLISTHHGYMWEYIS